MAPDLHYSGGFRDIRSCWVVECLVYRGGRDWLDVRMGWGRLRMLGNRKGRVWPSVASECAKTVLRRSRTTGDGGGKIIMLFVLTDGVQ